MPSSTVDEPFEGFSEASSDREEAWEESMTKRRKLSLPRENLAVKSRVESRLKSKKNNQLTPHVTAGVSDSKGPQNKKLTTFAELGVAPWLVSSLASMAITRPTEIQKGCIPEILKGCDCIGGSRTGSGKTVAFAVPVLQTWAQDPMGIYAVVLTPTRLAPEKCL
jgi:ATP-dependent RNA helicase DDX49/DBP8